MMYRLRQHAFCATILLVFVALTSCKDKIDEAQRIRTLIRQGADAAMQRDVKGMLTHVANDFHGDVGFSFDEDSTSTVTRKQLSLVLMRYLRRPQAPYVVIRSLDVQLDGKRAHADVVVLVAQSEAAAKSVLAGAQADAFKLLFELENRDDEWWVTEAKRIRVDAKEFLLGN